MKTYVLNAATLFFFIIGMLIAWMILALPFISISVAIGASAGDFFDRIHLGDAAMVVTTMTSLIILFGISGIGGGMLFLFICSQIGKFFLRVRKDK